MKRARVTTRSEAARARARVSPVHPDALLALLNDADVAVGQIVPSTSTLASLTADLVARHDEARMFAVAQVASTRAALHARRTRVLGFVKRVFRKQFKEIVADFEAVDVSKEQLRAWAAVVARAPCPDLDCAFAALPLLASPHLVQSPVTGVSSIIGMQLCGELGSVATGDGLRVVSVSGPGLKWFKPHTRNEFSVVLAQANGRVPVWLTTADVHVEVVSPVDTPAADVRSEFVGQGTVSVVYACLSADAPEAVLRLSVSGAPVADTAGGLAWCVRVPRKPLADHECAAVGTHVRTLTVVGEYTDGLAVSADEKWLVVGLSVDSTLSVYSLPGCELVRTFGGRGAGPLQFNCINRLCFAPNGNLIVTDADNKRLQEVTLEGAFVRSIDVRQYSDGEPSCVAVRDDTIALGCVFGDPCVVLFDFGTGAVTSRFGKGGSHRCVPGKLHRCTGIRFTLDGSHVVIAEPGLRLSLFTTAGVFVRCIGMGVLEGDLESMDVLQSMTGEYVVADGNNGRVFVFSPDGSELVRSWEDEDRQFGHPAALAAAGQHLYVMDAYWGRVHVYL